MPMAALYKEYGLDPMTVDFIGHALALHRHVFEGPGGWDYPEPWLGLPYSLKGRHAIWSPRTFPGPGPLVTSLHLSRQLVVAWRLFTKLLLVLGHR